MLKLLEMLKLGLIPFLVALNSRLAIQKIMDDFLAFSARMRKKSVNVKQVAKFKISN